jgi:hypothetical protein
MRKSFLVAFTAGKRSVEERFGWKYVLFLVVAVVLWNVLESWLVLHYSLRRLPSFLLSGAVAALLVFIFVLVKQSIINSSKSGQ